MNDEFNLQVTPKERDSSLILSKVRSSLIARGRKDAEVLAVLAETEAEFELTPESAIKPLSYLHVSNKGRSLEDVRKDAENGDAKSQYLVADSPGLHNVEPLTWFRKAAEQGYAPAQFKLGAMYDPSVWTFWRGEPKDISQAVCWYTKAAEQGLGQAAFNLGSIYANGEGRAQDYSNAVRWYRRAADGGLKEAQYNLGLMYANGDGLLQDFDEAAKWYRKAAEQGVAEACFNLGVSYESGKGVARDGTEAAKWYLEAAAHSYNYKAEFNIGLKYEKGNGVAQDYVEAYKWLHLAVYDSPDINGAGKYAAVRDRVSARLTPEKIVEALRKTEAILRRCQRLRWRYL